MEESFQWEIVEQSPRTLIRQALDVFAPMETPDALRMQPSSHTLPEQHADTADKGLKRSPKGKHDEQYPTDPAHNVIRSPRKRFKGQEEDLVNQELIRARLHRRNIEMSSLNITTVDQTYSNIGLYDGASDISPNENIDSNAGAKLLGKQRTSLIFKEQPDFVNLANRSPRPAIIRNKSDTTQMETTSTTNATYGSFQMSVMNSSSTCSSSVAAVKAMHHQKGRGLVALSNINAPVLLAETKRARESEGGKAASISENDSPKSLSENKAILVLQHQSEHTPSPDDNQVDEGSAENSQNNSNQVERGSIENNLHVVLSPDHNKESEDLVRKTDQLQLPPSPDPVIESETNVGNDQLLQSPGDDDKYAQIFPEGDLRQQLSSESLENEGGVSKQEFLKVLDFELGQSEQVDNSLHLLADNVSRSPEEEQPPTNPASGHDQNAEVSINEEQQPYDLPDLNLSTRLTEQEQQPPQSLFDEDQDTTQEFGNEQPQPCQVMNFDQSAEDSTEQEKQTHASIFLSSSHVQEINVQGAQNIQANAHNNIIDSEPAVLHTHSREYATNRKTALLHKENKQRQIAIDNKTLLLQKKSRKDVLRISESTGEEIAKASESECTIDTVPSRTFSLGVTREQKEKGAKTLELITMKRESRRKKLLDSDDDELSDADQSNRDGTLEAASTSLGRNLKQMTMRQFIQKLASKPMQFPITSTDRQPDLKLSNLLQSSTKTDKNMKRRPPKPTAKTVKPLSYSLPVAITKEVFRHFAKCKVIKEAMTEFIEASEKYWKMTSDEIVNIAFTEDSSFIRGEHVKKLLVDDGFVTTNNSLFALIEEYLPAEEWNILIPTSFAKGEVYPKQ